jgi:hypothetical protein
VTLVSGYVAQQPNRSTEEGRNPLPCATSAFGVGEEGTGHDRESDRYRTFASIVARALHTTVFLDSVKKATLIRSFETIPCMSDFGNHLRGRFLANRKRMTPSLNRAQAEQREQRAEAEQREREAAERRQAEADEVARRALEAGQSQGRLTPWGAPGGPHA